MIFSIDSNVLIYAFEPHEHRYAIASRIAGNAFLGDGMLTNQALGEFLKVCSGRYPERRREARQAAADWALLYPIAPTTTAHLITAGEIAERYRLQFWDSVILAVARSAGAEVLLSEDMQDRGIVEGVRIINPFNAGNSAILNSLLAS